MEVHHVVAIHRQLQIAMVEAHAGRERVAQVALTDGPTGVVRPGELAAAWLTGHVRVNAETARPCPRMVLLPHVREVNVANLILMVERYQQLAVADREVTGHRAESLSARGSSTTS